MLIVSLFYFILRFGLYTVGTAGYMYRIYWMFYDDYGMLWESLLWIHSHRCKQKYGYDDIGTRNVWSS